MKKIIAKTFNPKGERIISISRNFSVFPLPRVVRIEPSSFCNLRCIHCPTGTCSDIERGNMTEKMFSRIVDELKVRRRVDVAVLYHAGEPFINKKIFEMIRSLKSIGIRFIKTNTNGMLIADKILSQIIESGLNRIEFSLDGLSPEENNLIRRGSNYHQVASTIKKLLRKKKNLKIQTPDVWITNIQIPTEKNFKKRAVVPIPEYLLNDFADFQGKINFRSGYMIKWPGFDYSNRFKPIESSQIRSSETNRYCDKIMQTITFCWNGDVVPCCFDIMHDYVVGNITKQPLLEIWNNKQYRKLRKTIYSQKYLPLCSECRVIKP